MRILPVGFLFLVTAVCFNNCVGTSDLAAEINQRKFSLSIFSYSVTDFQVHAYYEPGAEPYVGSLGLLGGDIWDITEQSYIALFQNHPGRTVTVPRTLGDMTALSAQNTSNWSPKALVQLGTSIAAPWIQGNQIHLSVIFLNGYYQGNPNVLGVQISGNPFAFVFKDAIQGVGGTSTDQHYAEQAVTVHELGHVVGLVNLGVPLARPHQDSGHPGHSNNSACVMYWSVESAQNILASVAHFIGTGRKDLFGPEALQDGRSFHP